MIRTDDIRGIYRQGCYEASRFSYLPPSALYLRRVCGISPAQAKDILRATTAEHGPSIDEEVLGYLVVSLFDGWWNEFNVDGWKRLDLLRWRAAPGDTTIDLVTLKNWDGFRSDKDGCKTLKQLLWYFFTMWERVGRSPGLEDALQDYDIRLWVMAPWTAFPGFYPVSFPWSRNGKTGSPLPSIVPFGEISAEFKWFAEAHPQFRRVELRAAAIALFRGWAETDFKRLFDRARLAECTSRGTRVNDVRDVLVDGAEKRLRESYAQSFRDAGLQAP